MYEREVAIANMPCEHGYVKNKKQSQLLIV